MKIAERKESPIIGLTGMGGGLASYILYGGSGSSVYEISRSLRFDSTDSATYLSKDFTAVTFTSYTKGTVSCWVKRSALGYGVLAAGWDGGVSYSGSIQFNSTDNTLQVGIGGAGDYLFKTNATFRDVSAWYHIVVHWDRDASADADKIKVWVNGVAQTTSSTTYENWTSGEAQIFRNNNSNRIGRGDGDRYNNYFNGYLADYHYVDGQALDETSFGEFDTYGIWNPKEYNGTHGSAGFHLKFDDTSSNAALGTDSSGNSNDLTPTNMFGISGPADYASGISIPEGGGFYAERPPTNAFDGDLTTSTLGANTGTSVRWTYDSSWNLSGAVEVYPSGAGMTVSFDDGRTNVTAAADSWTEVSSSVDFTWINLYQGASYRGNLAGIRVNGTILINSTQSKLSSVVDSPTLYSAESGNNGGNYCTLNPQDRQINSSNVANGTVSNGNLSITSTGAVWTMIRGTMFVSSGKWYWECELGNNQYSTIGVITDEYKMAAYTNAWVNQTSDMYGYYPYGGDTFNGSTTDGSYATADTTAQGQVIGVALDMDNGTLTFYKNGVSLGQAFAALRGKNVAPAHWLYQHTGVGYADNYNFGQQPFRYTPPTDHLSLCTTNLAETAILDASKHFDVLTWSGNGPATTVAREITGLDMEAAPDFVWAKTRTGTGYHNTVFDAGRGYGVDNVLVTDEAWDQGSATGGRMKSTSSSSITFEPVGGVDGNSSVWYDESGHTYVAWTWNAGSNSNRTYNVKVVSDSGNKYRFNDHGTSAVTLDLEEGSTYVFDASDSSVDCHPFVLGTAANSGEYSTGVTYTLDGVEKTYSQYTTVSDFNAATTRKLTITVPSGAPTLYYWCSVHSGMGGQINTNTNVGSSVLSGSLTSTYYNTAAHWSLSSSIGTAGNVFDGSLGTSGAVNSSGSAVTITTSSFSARRIRFYKNGNDDANLAKITVNGTDYFFPLQTSSTGWTEIDLGSTITVTSFTTTWYGNYTLYAIEVDGAILTDSTVTPTSVPTVNTIVRANQAAGFSIVRWQGDSSAHTVPHGLAGEPSFIIAKNWNADTSWRVYHNGGDFNTVSGGAYSPFYHWVLDTTATRDGSASSAFTNTRATSTHFSVAANFNTDGMIAYCFQEIEGYSKFGTYLGNGLADGPFVFTGFRPRWLLIRRADGGGTGYDWHIYDSERDPINQMSRFLGANTSQTEQTRSDGANYTDMYLDFLSNGFKWRNTYSSPNNSGGNFIYAAFAENPFRTSRAR